MVERGVRGRTTAEVVIGMLCGRLAASNRALATRYGRDEERSCRRKAEDRGHLRAAQIING